MLQQVVTALLMLTVTACGPIYTTEYEIIPPDTHHGILCADNCMSLYIQCEELCRIKENTCMAMANLNALNKDFDRWCQSARFNTNSTFGELKPCYPSHRVPGNAHCYDALCFERCKGHYHSCHKNCGGEVIPYRCCIAFCR